MCKGSSDQLNMFRVHIANISDPALLHTCAPLTMRTESDFNMVCYVATLHVMKMNGRLIHMALSMMAKVTAILGPSLAAPTCSF